MKLNIDSKNRRQPDPFILEDGGRFYIFVSGVGLPGVEAYSADDIFGETV